RGAAARDHPPRRPRRDPSRCSPHQTHTRRTRARRAHTADRPRTGKTQELRRYSRWSLSRVRRRVAVVAPRTPATVTDQLEPSVTVPLQERRSRANALEAHEAFHPAALNVSFPHPLPHGRRT